MTAATSSNGFEPSNDAGDRLPIKMLNDRILVRIGGEEGERRSSGGILIPATAQVGKRLAWAEVVASPAVLCSRTTSTAFRLQLRLSVPFFLSTFCSLFLFFWSLTPYTHTHIHTLTDLGPVAHRCS